MKELLVGLEFCEHTFTVDGLQSSPRYSGILLFRFSTLQTVFFLWSLLLSRAYYNFTVSSLQFCKISQVTILT